MRRSLKSGLIDVGIPRNWGLFTEIKSLELPNEVHFNKIDLVATVGIPTYACMTQKNKKHAQMLGCGNAEASILANCNTLLPRR